MEEPHYDKGDQATIVGGAIQYVKELEQMIHSLEAQKLTSYDTHTTIPVTQLTPNIDDYEHGGNKFTLKSSSAAADVEVTLIETHANLRILFKKNPRQLSKLVSGFQSLRLTILHLSVTTLVPLVLYSFSVKVEERCHLTDIESISQAVHQMLRIIEEDVSSYIVNLLAP
ncbi:transcription factor bHLH94-like [Silene latifolia]|uniref:transcription factor bHLH94-like n=1 Tax=Silene latifolia TaxID=37657 RepID=UPI003D7710ED